MEQIPLYHEDVYEAIRTAVQALGGSKKVGSTLWPDKLPDKAGELLNNCLNHTRPEKLDPEQVVYLIGQAQKIGVHSIVNFIGTTCNYSFTPIEPEDEKAELQKQFIESMKIQKALIERMEALS